VTNATKYFAINKETISFDKILWFKYKVHTTLLINLRYCVENLTRCYRRKLLTKNM